MSYDLPAIEKLWLGEGSIVCIPPNRLVDCFNACEDVLGRDWVEGTKTREFGTGTGPLVTLSIAGVGARLIPVMHARGFGKLAARLRKEERSAFSELTAAYLCLNGQRDVRLEFEEPVPVGDSVKLPDFRLAAPGEDWTYIEVAAPDRSDANKDAAGVMTALSEELWVLPSNATIEILLLRVPLEHESRSIAKRALALAEKAMPVDEELDGLAVISVNSASPCVIEGRNYRDRVGPVLGIAKTFTRHGKPDKHVVVRVPIIDERAEEVLSREARQLPKTHPGLLMFDVNSNASAFRGWPPLLESRLQPRLHTRVGAICMFHSGSSLTSAGEGIITETRVLTNSHAAIAVPQWLTAQLERQSGVPHGA
jgi:hypothetical protein